MGDEVCRSSDVTLNFLCVTDFLPAYPCTVPSSAPSFAVIVPLFLQVQSALPHTAVLIVLGWK